MSLLGKIFGNNKSAPLTSLSDPKPELQTEAGLHDYLSRLSKLDRSGLCVEFATVRAAKHNLMAAPTGFNDRQRVQTLVTDLTDKSTLICMLAFGRDAVLAYNGGDVTSFNALINQLDDQLAAVDLPPEEHGDRLFKQLLAHLS